MKCLSDNERIYAIVCEENEKIPDTLVEALFEIRVYELLDQCGIPNYYVGYKYLKDAIISVLDKSEHKWMTKTIYPQIANKYGTSSSCVDSNMRHAIATAWNSGKLNEYFTSSYKPTNSQFIFLISNILK
ncbi:MAG: sporulation initiation factor Spo0A C-terminal domain-containing protein [Peptostreptococcaceae bacterium]|nr:sporulation initiation factor Spo0A C-terminal domain-containing protein [Peptostreptococcaceae bacterium]